MVTKINRDKRHKEIIPGRFQADSGGEAVNVEN